MNETDQKYLLNSEILVIVKHMMSRRGPEFFAPAHEKQTDECEDEEMNNESDEDEMESLYSGEESPELVGSDLCDSEIDTDDLMCSHTDTDNDSPKHLVVARTKPPLKKKESFFRFLMQRAQQWRRRRSGKSSDVSKATLDMPISTVCPLSKSLHETTSNHSCTEMTYRTKSDKNAILSPTNFSLELQEMSAAKSKMYRTLLETDVGSNEDIDEQLLACTVQTSSSSMERRCRSMKPPGLMIPRMGYFGLSEGNLLEAVSRAHSEESISRKLSEESLLGEYLHDMSLVSDTNQMTNKEQKERQLLGVADTEVTVGVETTASVHTTAVSPPHKSVSGLTDNPHGLEAELEALLQATSQVEDRPISLFIEEEVDRSLSTSFNDVGKPARLKAAASCSAINETTPKKLLGLDAVGGLQQTGWE